MRPASRPVAGGLVTLLVLSGLSWSASAIAGTDEDEARAAMRRGTAALERGDASGALEDFERAERLVPAANAPWFFAGDALERLGRWRAAVTSFDTYLAKDPNVSDAPKIRERIAAIRAAHFPGRLRIVAPADGTEIAIDGKPPIAPPREPVELDPGVHRLEVRAPGRAPIARDVEIVGDAEASETFALPELATRPKVAVASTPAETPEAGGTFPWRTAGWSAAGAGAAGFVTMLVLDSAILGPKFREYERHALAATPAEIAREGRLYNQIAPLRSGILVGYVASAAVALGGAAVGLFGPHARSASSVAVAPFATSTSAGFAAATLF